MSTDKTNRSRVVTHFTTVFWLLFIAAAIPASIQLGHKPHLQKQYSPSGIVSLEMAFRPALADNIVHSWDTTIQPPPPACNSCKTDGQQASGIYLLGMAKADVWVDFIFIIFYTLFGTVIILKLESDAKEKHLTKKWMRVLPWLPLVAGLSDVIENIGMLGYINDGLNHTLGQPHLLSTYIYASFAHLKFYIIIGFLLYLLVRCWQLGLLARLSDYIVAKSFQLWRYRVIVIGIACFTLPLWVADQGQDLLVNINNSWQGVVFFLFVITISAFLNWYLAKLFFADSYVPPFVPWREPEVKPADDASRMRSPEELAKEQEEAENKLRQEKKASRFLGVITFLLPAFGILHALDKFKINYGANFFSPSVWLIISATMVYAILQKDLIVVWFNGPLRRFRTRAFLIIVTLLFAVGGPVLLIFIASAYNGSQDKSPQSLAFVALDLVLLAVAFLLFICLRTIINPGATWLGKKIGVPVIISAIVLSAFFLATNFNPMLFTHGQDLTWVTFPVVFSAFIFYMVFFTSLLRLGQKTRIHFTLLLLVILVAINIASYDDYHNVRTINAKEGAIKDDSLLTRNMRLTDYFAHWLLQRESEISKADSFPVFFVNTYGGGIRAAAFTSFVIERLDSLVALKDTTHIHDLEHYVFSYSGASGGTIGASVMSAYRYAWLNNSSFRRFADSDWIKLYGKDYLTTILSGMFGNDVLGASLSGHVWWQDRNTTEERLWETQLAASNINYSQDFYHYWNLKERSRYEIPLLFSNTCNMDDGLKGITAPVALDSTDFPADIIIGQKLLDPRTSMRLSTAAFLSARFPFISPTGKMGDAYHFLDGGAKDNSGAQTSEYIYIALSNILKDSTPFKNYPKAMALLRKVKFYFISLKNSSPENIADPDKKISNPFQLTSALSALFNSAVNGNSVQADSTLRTRYKHNYATIWPDVDCVMLNKDSTNPIYFSPALPLGWQISEGALNRLMEAAKRGSTCRNSSSGEPDYNKILGWIRSGLDSSAAKKPGK